MFSGLVLGRGRVIVDPEPAPGGGARLRVRLPGEVAVRLSVGASLAVAGVCLTVIEPIEDGTAEFEVSPETLRRTTLAELRRESEVNLEPALRLGDALGGHWVQGHVDAVGEVLSIDVLGDHREVGFSLPEEVKASVVEKGSITVDGVSLTVSALAPGRFSVALVPHTLAVTTLGGLTVGQRVNLEVDVLAKYVQQAVASYLPRSGA
jgi:riboflavin synthase